MNIKELDNNQLIPFFKNNFSKQIIMHTYDFNLL